MAVTADDLPAEILQAVLSHTPLTLCAAVLVSKHWHRSLTPFLYATPQIRDTEAYLTFADTILTSRHRLGKHVRYLNLEKVVGTLKTARLPELMRACPRVREFTNPQAAMTGYMISALSHWTELRLLDLCHVCERFEISKVVNAASALEKLHTLRWPRCQVSGIYPVKKYPPNLRHLAVRGGVRNELLRKMAEPNHPKIAKLESVAVNYSPTMAARPVLDWLRTLPDTLRRVEITWPLIAFGHNSLDPLLTFLPDTVEHVRVSIDYLSPRFLESGHRGLRRLDFIFSGVGSRRSGFEWEDLQEALEAYVTTPEDEDEAEDELETSTGTDLKSYSIMQASSGMGERGREKLFPRLETVATSPRLDDLLFGKIYHPHTGKELVLGAYPANTGAGSGGGGGGGGGGGAAGAEAGAEEDSIPQDGRPRDMDAFTAAFTALALSNPSDRGVGVGVDGVDGDGEAGCVEAEEEVYDNGNGTQLSTLLHISPSNHLTAAAAQALALTDAVADRREFAQICARQKVAWWQVPDSTVPDEAQWHF